MAGTINSKTKRTAEAWGAGQSYYFAALKRVFNAKYKELKPDRILVPESRKPKEKQATKKLSELFTWYSLAWRRMNDLKLLASLRGGRYSEHRNMAAWTYAVAAANYCPNEHALRSEVDGFIRDYLTEPDKKVKTINYESTVKRFNDYNKLKQTGMSSGAIDKELGYHGTKYKNTRVYITKVLEITEAEQRKLDVIYGKDEERYRNTTRKHKARRDAGVIPRDEYLSKKAKKASEALRLRLEGLSMRAVAEQMGTSVSNVHRWIKAAQNGSD